MSASTNLMLPFLAQGQAQKHVTLNEALLRLDALVQLSVVSAAVAAEPASPGDGALYLLPAGKTGAAWGAMAVGALAYYRDGVWEELAPREGWLAFVKDTDTLMAFDGAAWRRLLLDQDVRFSGDVRFDVTSADPLTISSSDSGAGIGAGANLDLFRDSASPEAADDMARIRFRGRNSAGADTQYAFLRAILSDPTAGSEDGAIAIHTRIGGAIAERFSFGAGLYAAAASGGDKGAGTINAVAVYDDNTLLTCGPLELMRDGKVDLAKWDAIAADNAPSADAPPRRHAVMHSFAAMLAEGFDPRDPENYCARLRADGAVPGLFSEGEWRALAQAGDKPDVGTAMTRVFLALDNLAVAFDALVARHAALAARLDALDRG